VKFFKTNTNNGVKCENCVKAVETITVGNLNSAVEFEQKEEGESLDETIGDVNSLSGKSGTYLAGNPGKTLSEKGMEASNPGKLYPMGVNVDRLEKANAAITAITVVAWFVGKLIKENQVQYLNHQINTTPSVVDFIQNAISGKIDGVKIPEKYLNAISLQSITNYVLSGQTIYTETTDRNGNHLKSIDTDLTKVAKKVVEAYNAKMKQKLWEAEMEKIEKYKSKPAVDQTSNKNF